MQRASLLSISLLIALGAVQSALAVDYPLPPAGSRVVGHNQTYTVQASDRNIQAVARHFDTAAMVIIEANNAIAPVPGPGTVITIPSQLILPDTPREGIVINLAELRLYYYPPDANIVQVFPIGIGQQGLETPVSTTRITQKIPNPTWTPTAGIRQRSKAKGVELPEVVPAGPRNPLGRYAMRLGIGNGEYLIHGTNAPDSVGLRVSSGCIRMNAENIKTLFSEARVGTPVAIINEPVKYSVEADGRRYIEVHRPLAQQEQENTQTLPIAFDSRLTMQISDSGGNRQAIDNALYRRAGYPIAIPAGANVTVPGTAVQAAQNQNAVQPVADVQSASLMQ